MRGWAFHTYCTRRDWEPVAQSWLANLDIKFTRSGVFSNPEVEVFLDPRELPNFGNSATGDNVSDDTLLIMPAAAIVATRAIHRNDGQIAYAVDHVTVPSSIIWRPGGLYPDMRVLVKGDLGTASKDSKSEELYKLLIKNAALKSFFEAKSYRIGPEALRLYQEGYRLTHSVSAPVEYDLRLSQ